MRPDPPDLAALLDEAAALARSAGRAILDVYDDPASFDATAKADGSPLTRADLAAHRVLEDGLRELTPDLPVLSEESAEVPYDRRSGWTRFWLVDPLDGTKEFLKRNGEFTVNVGTDRRGQPRRGDERCRHANGGAGPGRRRRARARDRRTYGGAHGAAAPGAPAAQGRRRRSGRPIAPDGAVRVVASRSHGSPETEAFIAASSGASARSSAPPAAARSSSAASRRAPRTTTRGWRPRWSGTPPPPTRWSRARAAQSGASAAHAAALRQARPEEPALPGRLRPRRPAAGRGRSGHDDPSPHGTGHDDRGADDPSEEATRTTPRHDAPLAAKDAGARLTHLKLLEAEAIHIMREVAAEFDDPVMLYSIGKDSSVMLHLAQKAFYPGTPPFPLMHIDTTWKFREMIAFRDRRAKEVGMELIVHVNEEGLAQGIGPFTHGSQVHTDVMKTQALKQALSTHGFDAAFGGARRDEEKSRAKERVYSFRDRNHAWDPKQPAARAVEPLQRQAQEGRVDPRLPALQLDRAGRLAVHLARGDPDRAAVLREGTAGRAARRHVDHGRRRPDAAGGPAKRLEKRRSASAPWAATRSPARSQRGGHAAQDHPRDAAHSDQRATGPRDRPGPGGQHGEEEARGVLLMSLAGRIARRGGRR